MVRVEYEVRLSCGCTNWYPVTCHPFPGALLHCPEHGDVRGREAGQRRVVPDGATAPEPCDFDHPHPSHPCGRRIIPGVTTCQHCGHLDASPECREAGCWQPATEADVDGLYQEAWGLTEAPS